MVRIHSFGVGTPATSRLRGAARIGSLMAALWLPQVAAAACPGGGSPRPCPGVPGVTSCDIADCPLPEAEVITGIIRPKFLVLSVVYAPPGSADCADASTVSYSAESALSSALSVSDSTTESTGLSAKAESSVGGNSGSLKVNFSTETSTTNSSSVTVTFSTTDVISGARSCSDGINHENDTIWVLLNPQIRLTSTDGHVMWEPVSGTMDDIQWLTVSQLKGDSALSAGMANAFAAYNFTSADFDEILKADPFASDPHGEPDAERFQWVTSVPYVPVTSTDFEPGGSEVTLTQSQQNVEATSASTSSTVGFEIEVSGSGFGGLLKTTFGVSRSMTWTTAQSSSSTTDERTVASLKMGVPSESYTGTSRIGVYYDRIYRTFAFFPIEGRL